jgi:hypothetical protein
MFQHFLNGFVNGFSQRDNPLEFEFLKKNVINSDKDNCELNIFVHGYSAIFNNATKQEIFKKTSIANQHHNWCFCWSSGFVLNPFLKHGNIELIKKLVKLEKVNNQTIKQATLLFDHFKDNQEKAEHIGKHFLLESIKRELAKDNITYSKINMFGHSLGARLICHAIKENPKDAKDLKIKDVVLLGGAVSIDENWNDIIQNIDGCIHNFYSSKDFVLILKPDTEKCVGRYHLNGDPINSSKIVNHEVSCLHWQYWDIMPEVFSKLNIKI